MKVNKGNIPLLVGGIVATHCKSNNKHSGNHNNCKNMNMKMKIKKTCDERLVRFGTPRALPTKVLQKEEKK